MSHEKMVTATQDWLMLGMVVLFLVPWLVLAWIAVRKWKERILEPLWDLKHQEQSHRA